MFLCENLFNRETLEKPLFKCIIRTAFNKTDFKVIFPNAMSINFNEELPRSYSCVLFVT